MSFNRNGFYLNKKDILTDVNRYSLNLKAKKINYRDLTSPSSFKIEKQNFRGMRKFLERLGIL